MLLNIDRVCRLAVSFIITLSMAIEMYLPGCRELLEFLA